MAEIAAPRPLTAADDRLNFDCGKPSINLWLQRHAWASHADGLSRTNVICTTSTGKLAGFVSLSAAQIERGALAKSQQRNRPDPIPVTLLGQLAIDKNCQGRGYARSLLVFAFRTALTASRSIGSFAMITHPLDDKVRTFYAQFGFRDLPFDPRRAMIVRMADLAKSGF